MITRTKPNTMSTHTMQIKTSSLKDVSASLNSNLYGVLDDAKRYFTDKEIEMLVRAIQIRPALWDGQNKNRKSYPRLWKKVVQEMDLPESHIIILKKRWESLKAAFYRAKRKTEAGEISRPYKFNNILSFLNNKHLACQSSLGVSVSPSPSSATSPMPVSVQEKLSRNDLSQIKPTEQSQMLDSFMTSTPSEQFSAEKPQNSNQLTGALIATELDKLSERAQRELRRRIFDLIDEVAQKDCA